MEMEVEEEKWVLIRKEALAVATIMQMHPRFARSKCEHDHLRGVADVRARLRAPLKHEVMCVVRPFILVITSADTTGAIRCCALESVARFIRQGVLCSAQDLEETLAGVLECRFDSSEAGVDELGILPYVSSHYYILRIRLLGSRRRCARWVEADALLPYFLVWFRRVEVAVSLFLCTDSLALRTALLAPLLIALLAPFSSRRAAAATAHATRALLYSLLCLPYLLYLLL